MKNTFLGIIFLLGTMLGSCGQKNNSNMTDESTEETVVLQDNDQMAQPANDSPVDIDQIDEGFWDSIDFDIAVAPFPEITTQGVEVRGNDLYTIYTLDEMVLFDTDQANIKAAAADDLKQIAASFRQRHANGHVRVYGYTDARGSASYNKELAEQRAEAVKQWLVENGDVDASLISVHPVGETRPVATTPAGRKLNRRVDIVVKYP